MPFTLHHNLWAKHVTRQQYVRIELQDRQQTIISLLSTVLQYAHQSRLGRRVIPTRMIRYFIEICRDRALTYVTYRSPVCGLVTRYLQEIHTVPMALGPLDKCTLLFVVKW